MLWSSLHHRSFCGIFGHFISWDDRYSRGKNISEFRSSFKPCKLLERECWFQRSTKNCLAFKALYGVPGKMTPFFQGWKLRSQRDSHCYNCLLDHLISHFISQEKGTGLYWAGLLLSLCSTQAAQRGTKTVNQMFVTAYRREVTAQTYVLTMTEIRAIISSQTFLRSPAMLSTHKAAEPSYTFVKTKMSSQFILLCLCGWKEATSYDLWI